MSKFAAIDSLSSAVCLSLQSMISLRCIVYVFTSCVYGYTKYGAKVG